MTWSSIQDQSGTFRFCQQKTSVPLERPLHKIARQLLGGKKEGLLFRLPTQDGANKLLQEWCKQAGVKKHITWHCARHSFSVLLQDEGIDIATVAGMLTCIHPGIVIDISSPAPIANATPCISPKSIPPKGMCPKCPRIVA